MDYTIELISDLDWNKPEDVQKKAIEQLLALLFRVGEGEVIA